MLLLNLKFFIPVNFRQGDASDASKKAHVTYKQKKIKKQQKRDGINLRKKAIQKSEIDSKSKCPSSKALSKTKNFLNQIQQDMETAAADEVEPVIQMESSDDSSSDEEPEKMDENSQEKKEKTSDVKNLQLLAQEKMDDSSQDEKDNASDVIKLQSVEQEKDKTAVTSSHVENRDLDSTFVSAAGSNSANNDSKHISDSMTSDSRYDSCMSDLSVTGQVAVGSQDSVQNDISSTQQGKSSKKKKHKKRKRKNVPAIPAEFENDEELRKYWYQRYRLFSRFDEGILMDRGV